MIPPYKCRRDNEKGRARCHTVTQVHYSSNYFGAFFKIKIPVVRNFLFFFSFSSPGGGIGKEKEEEC